MQRNTLELRRAHKLFTVFRSPCHLPIQKVIAKGTIGLFLLLALVAAPIAGSLNAQSSEMGCAHADGQTFTSREPGPLDPFDPEEVLDESVANVEVMDAAYTECGFGRLDPWDPEELLDPSFAARSPLL